MVIFMRIKRAVLLITIGLCLLLPGCSTSQDSLKEMARFEMQYYNQARPMMDRILSLYNELHNEKISLQQYQAELIVMKEPARKLNKEYQNALKKHQLLKEDEKSQLYVDGLYYGHYLVLEPYGYIVLMKDAKAIEEIDNIHEIMMLTRERKVTMFENACSRLIEDT